MDTSTNFSNHPDGKTPAPRTFTTSTRLLALLVALVLIATACGSTADSVTDAAEGTADQVEEAVSGDDEAMEDSAVETDDFSRVEEAMEDEEEEAMEDEEESFAAPSNDSGDEALVERATQGDAEEALVDTITDDGNDAENAVAEGEGAGLFGTVDPDELSEPPVNNPTSQDPRFTDYGIRTFIDTRSDPLSTFSLDVDTGSYSIARGFLEQQRQLPPRESVRVEEYVNFFDYGYDAPRDGLDIEVDGGPSPFDDDTWLVRVGVKAEEIDNDDRQPVALTFVVDTSGSMATPDRLGLVQQSLSLLVEELDRDDTVAIVTYSGSSDIILEPTEIRDRDRILDAIDNLRTGGSTNLQAGLDAGYELAREAFREDGVNRVIVASDGLANAGITSGDALAAQLRSDADAGIGLVTVGYGLNGINDTTMEQLADQSDGFYAYVDTIDEAERLFSEDLTSTLITAAIDAKIQVAFDDEVVDEYRLIGYENRAVADDDFRNDEVDAGELGAGHQATALYEVVFDRDVNIDSRAELGFVSLRWEDPETGDVIEIDQDIDMRDLDADWTETSSSFRQATVVATFAEILRDNPYAESVSLEALSQEVDSLARELDTDEFDQFADLVEIAEDYS